MMGHGDDARNRPVWDKDTVIHNPTNHLERIDHLWAVLSSDEGGEGLVGAPIQSGYLSVPLIAADEKRLESIVPIARDLAKRFGKPMKIVKFTVREEIEVIQP